MTKENAKAKARAEEQGRFTKSELKQLKKMGLKHIQPWQELSYEVKMQMRGEKPKEKIYNPFGHDSSAYD